MINKEKMLTDSQLGLVTGGSEGTSLLKLSVAVVLSNWLGSFAWKVFKAALPNAEHTINNAASRVGNFLHSIYTVGSAINSAGAVATSMPAPTSSASSTMPPPSSQSPLTSELSSPTVTFIDGSSST